ncbi:MAG TPA: hypothetical protein DEH78_12550 [Solibacterales bacterium]|nr:hypothetical protein [Bryobacterales bacterium]
MRDWLRRIGYLARRSRMERELAEEMEAHREAMGAPAGFGNRLRLREEAAEVYGWGWLDRLRQDVTFGLRLLVKAPAFTLSAVLILALGIGVNLSGFQIFNLAVLKPLEVKDPHTIVRFTRRSPQASTSNASYPHMKFLGAHAKTLSAVMGVSRGEVALDGNRTANARFVTGNWFSETGARAAAGRLLEPGDDSATAPLVAVLTHPFWTAHFGGDPSVVGRTIRVNGKLATVVGVGAYQQADLDPSDAALWLPLEQEPQVVEGSRLRTSFEKSFVLFGRLRQGESPKAAEGEARSLVEAMRKAYPKDIWDGEWLPAIPGAYIAHIDEREKEEMYPVLGLIAALVLSVLAAACANLGNLMLARGLGRAREFSIRSAVGASRGRLIRQLLTESLLLAALGTAAGLAASYWGARYILSATGAPSFLNPAFDWRLALVAGGLAAMATLVFGFVPALQATRANRARNRLRFLFVGVQVAACCLLLVVAGLFVRGLLRALTANPGFEYANAISVTPALAEYGYTPEASAAYFEALRARIGAAPGVASVAASSLAPFGNMMSSFEIARPGGRQRVVSYSTDASYFETLRIPIRQGRAFRDGEANAVVVSEALANTLWPGQSALGQELPGRKGTTVVGVAGTARTVAFRDSSTAEAYFPANGESLLNSVLVVRAAGGVEAVAAKVSEAARSVDPRMRPKLELVQENFERRTETARAGALIVSALGLAALALAAVGVYGIAAYTVAQQTREIGIRVAIGAPAADVLRVTVGRFRWPVSIGALCGLGLAAALSSALASELYGVSPLDPVSYAAAGALFLVVAAASLAGPVRRALRIEPARALRYE